MQHPPQWDKQWDSHSGQLGMTTTVRDGLFRFRAKQQRVSAWSTEAAHPSRAFKVKLAFSTPPSEGLAEVPLPAIAG